MPNFTPNLNLKKPAGNEYYDVQDQNGNMDIIDTKIKQNADAVAAHLADNVKHITSAERTAWNGKQNALGYTPVNKAGDTMTGKLTTKGTSGAIADTTGSKGNLEVQSVDATAAAFMTFHRPGSFATYFGLDTDNKLKVGGWSSGASAFAIWHEGMLRINNGELEYYDGGAWQSVGIQPTKPRNVSLVVNAPTMNVYYTLLNISGKGTLSNLKGHYQNGSNYYHSPFRVRITIDGVVSDIGEVIIGEDNNNANLDFNTYFKSSIKIEVMQTMFTGGTGNNLRANATYALV